MTRPNMNKQDEQPDWLNKLGLNAEAITECYRAFLNCSLSLAASKAHDKLIITAPEAIAMCQTLAARKSVAQTYITLGDNLLKLSYTDKPLAAKIAEDFNVEFELKEPLTCHELGELFIFLGSFQVQIAEEAEKALKQFNEQKPGILAALVLFPKLKEIKAHEFMSSLSKQGERVNLNNPADYVITIFLALCLKREDIITQAINFRLATDVVSGLTRQSYIELGGEQFNLDETAQGYLNRRIESITKMPFLDGMAIHRAEQVLDRLNPLLSDLQKTEIQVLKEKRKLDDLSKVKSLDIKIQDEDGEITTLAEILRASSDFDEAMPQLMEIWEKFNSEDAELFTEYFFEGKSLNEIATERGWKYDRVQKRLNRLEKEITEILARISD